MVLSWIWEEDKVEGAVAMRETEPSWSHHRLAASIEGVDRHGDMDR